MIDWLTLRTPLNFILKDELLEKINRYIGKMELFDGSGELIRSKLVFDIDTLRSDEAGLFWQIQYSGSDVYMVIGASPASIEHGGNAFGSCDVRHCANVLLKCASNILGIQLPNVQEWDCRRLDFTHNYLLDDNSQVKQALKELRNGDGIRQKATCPKGDSVYFGQGSDLISGKIYDKGTQAAYLMKKLHKLCKSPLYTDIQLDLLNRVLRMELTFRRRWFDRLKNVLNVTDFETSDAYLDYLRHNKPWLELTEAYLNQLHNDYFSQYIGNIEVTDMGTLLENLIAIAPTAGRARAAHNTYLNIKLLGYEQVQASIPYGTFTKHRAMLIKAGLRHVDLQASNVVPFRRKTIFISQPVTSWEELYALA